tara:strand:- start:9168 stop:9398 length:231 start_codon:yes stop_codon:yes gene_type:complete
MSGEKYVKLNRKFFAEEMPSDMKRVFMLVINNTPCIPDDQKIFLCDNIFHYESIGDYSRNQILDILDDLNLFTTNE